VIPCAIRKWRRSWWSGQTRREITRFKTALRERTYDVVLDLQGLMKSAWIARQASGERHGYTWGSAREPLASLAYDVRHPVTWNQHAIARNRQLAAAALGYRLDGPVRYGMTVAETEQAVAVPYVVALHATSRADKLWPEADWRKLFAPLTARGLRIVLPWGTPLERERSERLAAGIDGVIVPAWKAPPELAGLFAGAQLVVGVDTGLLHLAVAAGVPALALFGPTDPALTGVHGERAAALNLGGNGVVPGADQVLEAAQKLLAAGAEKRAAQATLR
jgi:heptosyltransferase-1